MNWHKGNAAEAINLAKESKSLFIVYIKGEDEISITYDEFWSSEKIIKINKEENSVAMTINSGSEVFKQFSQIYPVMIVPTVYFIGNDGKPLEVIVGRINLDSFYDKIKQALKLHKDQLNVTSSQATGITNSNSENKKLNDEEERREQLSLEQKAEKARALLTEKRLEKERQEREEHRQRELERRQLGQDLNKLKQLKAETEMKEAKDEIRKQKEDDKKALENIRRQLELDRQERAKNFYQSKQLEEKKQDETAVKKNLINDAEREALMAEKMKTARLQFRFPDGSALVQQFSSSQLFQAAFDFILQNTSFKNFTMATTFPKREFGDEDKSKSFVDLGLAPSAILLVLPISSLSSHLPSPSSSNGANILSTIFSPVILVWTWIIAFLSGLFWPQAPTSPQAFSPSNQSSSTNDATRDSSSRPTNAKLDQRSIRTDNTTRQRKDGNIHRLPTDDDDNNTYNGNSTQQM